MKRDCSWITSEKLVDEQLYQSDGATKSCVLLDKFLNVLQTKLALNGNYNSSNMKKLHNFKVYIMKHMSNIDLKKKNTKKTKLESSVQYTFMENDSDLETLAGFGYRLWMLACYFSKTLAPTKYLKADDNGFTFSTFLSRNFTEVEQVEFRNNGAKCLFEYYHEKQKDITYTIERAHTDYEESIWLGGSAKNCLRGTVNKVETDFNDLLDSKLETHYKKLLLNVMTYLVQCDAHPLWRSVKVDDFLCGEGKDFDKLSCGMNAMDLGNASQIKVDDESLLGNLVEFCLQHCGAKSVVDYTADGKFKDHGKYIMNRQSVDAIYPKQATKCNKKTCRLESAQPNTDDRTTESVKKDNVARNKGKISRLVASDFTTLSLHQVDVDILQSSGGAAGMMPNLKLNSAGGSYQMPTCLFANDMNVVMSLLPPTLQQPISASQEDSMLQIESKSSPIDILVDVASYFSEVSAQESNNSLSTNNIEMFDAQSIDDTNSGDQGVVVDNVVQLTVIGGTESSLTGHALVDYSSFIAQDGLVGSSVLEHESIDNTFPVLSLVVVDASVTLPNEPTTYNDPTGVMCVRNVVSSTESDMKTASASQGEGQKESDGDPSNVISVSPTVVVLRRPSLQNPVSSASTKTKQPLWPAAVSVKAKSVVPCGIVNYNNLVCFINSAVQALYHFGPARKIIKNLADEPDASKTVTYLVDLFNALDKCPQAAINLRSIGLEYQKKLHWYNFAGEDSSGAMLMLLMQHCLPSPSANSWNYWFGGVKMRHVRFTSLDIECKKPEDSAPYQVNVQVSGECDLQTIVVQSYSDFGVELTLDAKFDAHVGDAIMYDMVWECPRVLGINVSRDQVIGNVVRSGTKSQIQEECAARKLRLDQFYSVVNYSLELNIGKALDPSAPTPPCTEYRLVSMIVRQTSWAKDGMSTGHYAAVCSKQIQPREAPVWYLLNDSVATWIPESDVVKFAGNVGDYTSGGKVGKVNTSKAAMLFADYLQYVRKDCLDEFYSQDSKDSQ